MRVDLETLSTLTARIALDPKQGDAQFVQIADASGLRGVLEQSAGRVEIRDCTAELLAVREAQLRFGTVLLQVAANLVLKRMATQVTSAETVSLELSAEQAQCGKLSVHAGTVLVSGEVLMRTCRLVQGEQGTLETDYAEITNFTLALGTLTVRAPHVVIHELKTGWGDPQGFWLSAKSARAGDLELGIANILARTSSLVCEGVSVRDGGFLVSSARAERLDAHTDGAAPAKPESAQRPAAESKSQERGQTNSAPRFVDWTVLDGLSGHAYVDLGVDMKIAMLPRKATHRMRLELEDGRIDYRSLEHGLAPLEDSLLDFSLRDDTLVLELGVPLLPTRGHGKPLVRWPLNSDDVVLATQHEVRLSVLAQPDLPEKPPDTEPDDDQPSKLQLHEVDATGVDIDLALEPPRSSPGAVLRTLGFERLAARGELRYRPDGQESGGRFTLKGDGLVVALAGLPVGDGKLDLEALRIHTLTSMNVGLRGTVPSELALEASEISLTNFKLG